MEGTHDARRIVHDLREGDVIKVPQYENALRVNYCGSLNGDQNAFIGVEFADEGKQTSAEKSMIVNRNSGRVYLTAGRYDKGEVTEIEIVARKKQPTEADA